MIGGFIRPRRVAPDAWKDWIREGLELMSRKWLAWIAVMTGLSLLEGSVGEAEPIAAFLALALGFNLALAVDFESDWAGMVSRFQASLKDAVRFGFQVGIFVLLVSFPLDTALAMSEAALRQWAATLPELPKLMPPELSRLLSGDLAQLLGQGEAVAMFKQIFGNSANHLLTWALVLPVGIGFLYPLRTLRLGFAEALLFGRKASTMNLKPVILTSVWSLLSVLIFENLGLYPLIPLVQGFWMAVNYAMFRDIFLGRPRNHPVRVRVENLAMVPAAITVPIPRRPPSSW